MEQDKQPNSSDKGQLAKQDQAKVQLAAIRGKIESSDKEELDSIIHELEAQMDILSEDIDTHILNQEEVTDSNELSTSSRKSKLASQRTQAFLAIAVHEEIYKLYKDAIERKQNMLNQKKRQWEGLADKLTKVLSGLESEIHTLSLYLGEDHHFEIIQDGTPAPADEVFYIMQSVLSMDEEAMIAADDGGGTYKDMSDDGAYSDWLRADIRNVDQVLPFQKCIVAVLPRRQDMIKLKGQEKCLATALAAMQEQALNNQCYWLLRNGENLAMLRASFSVADYIIPSENEFNEIFTDHSGKPIEPGDWRWDDAQDKADVKDRYYRQVAAIITGLLEHSPFYTPLPDNGLSLYGSDIDEGRIKLVNEVDHILTDGKKEFLEWIKDTNSQMKEGMRAVVGGEITKHRWANTNDVSYWPENMSDRPIEGIPYTIKKSSHPNYEFSIAFERTKKTWIAGAKSDRYSRGDYRMPQTKGTMHFNANNKNIVCVDTIEDAEIEDFFSCRRNRRHYLTLIPLLRSVKTVKDTDLEQEKPFKAMLIGKIMEAAGDDALSIEEQIDKLVSWWKSKNKWYQPLVSGQTDLEIRAIEQITKEYELRRKQKSIDTDTTIAKELELNPDTLLVAVRRRDNKIIVVHPVVRKYSHKVAAPDNIFVDVFAVGPRSRTQIIENKPLHKSTVSGWDILYKSEKWNDWHLGNKPSGSFTDTEIEELLQEAVEQAKNRLNQPTLFALRSLGDHYSGCNGIHFYFVGAGSASAGEYYYLRKRGDCWWSWNKEHYWLPINKCYDNSESVNKDTIWHDSTISSKLLSIKEVKEVAKDKNFLVEKKARRQARDIAKWIYDLVQEDWKEQRIRKYLAEDPTMHYSLAERTVSKIKIPRFVRKGENEAFRMIEQLLIKGKAVENLTVSDLMDQINQLEGFEREKNFATEIPSTIFDQIIPNLSREEQ